MITELNSSLLNDARKFMLANYKPFPIVMEKGDGAYLYDVSGRRYLDFASGIAVSSLGYANKKIQEAILVQSQNLLHVSNMFFNQPSIELAARLCEASSLDKVFFCNSGAEANEAMLKLARRCFSSSDPARIEIICMRKAFHGRTLGTISATGQDKYKNGFAPLLPGFKMVEFGDIDALNQAISKKTAAIILEPILGEAGIIVPPAGYLSQVRKVCDDFGVLMLLDEVQTGIGRTGMMFACQHENVLPDAMALAKGLGGGLPIGAMLVRKEYSDVLNFPSHGSTFGGNPVSCAAANVVMETVVKDEFISGVRESSNLLFEGLGRLRKKFPDVIQEVRGKGLFCGVQINKDADKIKEKALSKGLILNFCGEKVMRIAPPLVISQASIAEGVTIIEELLGE